MSEKTPREQLETVIGDVIPDVFGTSARRVLDAIEKTGGVILMPTRLWNLDAGDLVWLSHPLQKPGPGEKPLQTKPDFLTIDETVYVDVLGES